MRQNPARLRTVFWALLALTISAAVVLLSVGAVQAQAPDTPAAGAESAGASFPWLAVILFIVMAVLLTKFRSHPSYPKKAAGNCCAPVVDGNDSPFRIILDDDPAAAPKPVKE